MNLLERILEKYGFSAFVFAAALFALFLFAKWSGPHFVRWIDLLLKHFITQRETESNILAKLVQQNADHLLADEQRHREALERADARSSFNRHEIKNAIQVAMNSTIDKVEQTREYLCEQIDVAVEKIARTPEDITGEKEG